jgi:enediyne biosynthesis protein E5
MRIVRSWLAADARGWQILALGILVLLSNLWSSFGAGPASLIAACAGALSAQAIWARLKGQSIDWRSPLITALSVTLLLRVPNPLWHAAAAAAGISSKWLLRWHGKHFFNPANFAVILFLLADDRFWISPGQWGSTAWVVGLIVALAALVLGCARRMDVAVAFAAVFVGGLFARAASLGDPWTIPVHQMRSVALIIFTCFMITDPRSTPDHPIARIIFAGLVAWLALRFQIRLQLVGAPLYALAALSPLTPVFDRILRHRRFEWRPRQENVHEILA